MRLSLRKTAVGGAAAALLVGAAFVSLGTSSAGAINVTQAFGLSSDGTKLSSFSTIASPAARTVGTFSGLQGDTKLIGIDQRIANRALYGVGDQGGVYTINTSRAVVTKVGQLSRALEGTSFGVDFNPAADRLRIISDTGQSLRHNIETSVTELDGPTVLTPPTVFTGIEAVAYTNNDNVPATATTLYDVSAQTDTLYMQVPANSGTLVAVGSLRQDLSEVSGFDIDTALRNGASISNTGYLVGTLASTGTRSLFTVDLLTGEAKRIGTLPRDVADIAVVQG